jgi:16S rRNA G966 N2-methylase RsmD
MSALDIVNLENFRKIFRNIRKVGPLTTVRYIVSDLLFDMKYKIDTINTEQLENLEIDSPNKQHGVYYEGTNAYIFKNAFASLKIHAPNCVFIDFGSGKGKAMFMAAERGFRKVIGVEFSIELVDICRKNLEIFKAKTKSKTEFEIIHMDASQYEIPSEANVLFFSNPFNETLTRKVIDNILRSYDKSPRDTWVIHLYPQGNMAFVRHPRFRLVHESRDGFVFQLSPAV